MPIGKDTKVYKGRVTFHVTIEVDKGGYNGAQAVLKKYRETLQHDGLRVPGVGETKVIGGTVGSSITEKP